MFPFAFWIQKNLDTETAFILFSFFFPFLFGWMSFLVFFKMRLECPYILTTIMVAFKYFIMAFHMLVQILLHSAHLNPCSVDRPIILFLVGGTPSYSSSEEEEEEDADDVVGHLVATTAFNFLSAAF